MLKSPIYYHSTTDEGLEALQAGEPLREGTFLSQVKEGSRQLPKRPHRLKLDIPNESAMNAYWDWIREQGRSEKSPGKFWDEWRVTNQPIEDYTILEQEADPWNRNIQTGEPMDLSWRLLKRQTTLAEWDPAFPSQHGPVQMVRKVPSMYVPSMQREGVRPLPTSQHGNWERGITEEGKFDLSKPGTWWTTPEAGKNMDALINIRQPTGREVDSYWRRTGKFQNTKEEDLQNAWKEARFGNRYFGYRGDPSELDHQYRKEGSAHEPFPELLVHDQIDPSRLVLMPGQTENWNIPQMGDSEMGTQQMMEMPVQTGEPMDIAWRLLKRQRRGKRPPKRQKPMGNPFAIAASNRQKRERVAANKAGAPIPPGTEPLPELIFNDPEGKEEKHFDKQIVRRFTEPEHIPTDYHENPSQLHDEIRENTKAAWNEHGRKIMRDKQGLMTANKYAIITHKFDPPVPDAADPTQMNTHAITKLIGRYHPETNEPTGVIATTHGVPNLEGLGNQHSHMIDTTDPAMPMTYIGGNKSYYMEILDQLLKRATSLEAKKNKQKYDKDYHSSPSRVKYRVDLKRERRQRGVYGKGGKDMSHTKDGGLVAEAPSTNRARQGSNGQSTKKAFDIAWDILKELSTEDLRFAARTGGLRVTPERLEAPREEGGITPRAAMANTAGGLQGGRDVPLTVSQARELDLASHQRIGQSGDYKDEARPEGSMGDPNTFSGAETHIDPKRIARINEEKGAMPLFPGPTTSLDIPTDEVEEMPIAPMPVNPFSGDAPMGKLTDVYQQAPMMEHLPPSPGPEANPFPAVPRESRPVAVQPKLRSKSKEQILQELAERSAMAPDVPAPAPAPQLTDEEIRTLPFLNPRKVGVRRRAKPARGTPRSARREE